LPKSSKIFGWKIFENDSSSNETVLVVLLDLYKICIDSGIFDAGSDFVDGVLLDLIGVEFFVAAKARREAFINRRVDSRNELARDGTVGAKCGVDIEFDASGERKGSKDDKRDGCQRLTRF
jgi:hypothetical protein